MSRMDAMSSRRLWRGDSVLTLSGVLRDADEQAQERACILDWNGYQGVPLKGDGVTDCTAGFQAAIDYGASQTYGIDIFVPPAIYKVAKLVPKSKVRLHGALTGRRARLIDGTRLQSIAGSPIMFEPAGALSDFGLSGFRCIGPDTTLDGTFFSANGQSVGNCNFEALRIGGFGANGIKLDGAGLCCGFSNLFIEVGSYVPAAISAAIYFGSGTTEHWVYDVEASGGVGTVGSGSKSDSNAYKRAIYAHGSGHWFGKCVGEFADLGYDVPGSRMQFEFCRADNCSGNGWTIAGVKARLLGCLALRVGHDANDTYAGFETQGAGIKLSTCEVDGAGDANKVKYAFLDNASSGFDANMNIVDETCVGHEFVSKMYHNAVGDRRGSFSTPLKGRCFVTGATPSIGGMGRVVSNDASATNLTDFLGTVRGQEFWYESNTSNTTLKYNATKMKLTGAADIAMTTASRIRLRSIDGTNIEQIG